ncbi:hypothetical protein ACTWP5_00760 [Streptomyces sp. 4N509B]|uniref:hypothetical protein n=1 Tax=Streptomyces sp. 4N509B TaxID=3457413 RepID=UPI003FCF26BC
MSDNHGGASGDAPPAAAEPHQAAGEGGAPKVPTEFHTTVAHANQAIADQDWERAAVLTLRLTRHAARAYGDEHPYTLESRSLQAYVAYLGGDHLSSSQTFLDIARIRHEQGDPRAHEDLTRAVDAWWTRGYPPSVVARHGRALLDLWCDLVTADGSAAADLTLPHRIRQRLRAFTDECP